MSTSPSTADHRPTRGGTPRRSSVRIRVFAVLFALILINFLDRTALTVALPYIGKDITITPQVKGWILGAFFWTYLIFQIPGGWLLDRFGPRKIIGIVGTAWGLVELATGFVTGAFALLLFRLGLGAFEAPVYPAGAKVNSAWLPAKERARGATILDAASPLGAAFGGLLVTFLIGVFGSWRWAFFATGALTVLAALACFAYLRDRPEQHPKVSDSELDHIRSDQQEVAEETSPLPRMSDYLRSRSFWGMMIGRLGWAFAWWGIISWTPSYLVDALHFDLAQVGWGTFFVYGMGFVGEVLSGFLTDYLRRRTGRLNLVTKIMLVGSGAAGAVAIFLIPLTSNGYLALVALGVAVFFILFGGIYWAVPAWLAQRRQVGTVGGVMNVASAAGGALAPVVMGYAIAAAAGSYAGAFLFLAGAAVIYLIGSLLIDFEKPLAGSTGTVRVGTEEL
ncbi:MAG TPA: MFS transporter [Microlunatus sp.]